MSNINLLILKNLSEKNNFIYIQQESHCVIANTSIPSPVLYDKTGPVREDCI